MTLQISDLLLLVSYGSTTVDVVIKYAGFDCCNKVTFRITKRIVGQILADFLGTNKNDVVKVDLLHR